MNRASRSTRGRRRRPSLIREQVEMWSRCDGRARGRCAELPNALGLPVASCRIDPFRSAKAGGWLRRGGKGAAMMMLAASADPPRQPRISIPSLDLYIAWRSCERRRVIREAKRASVRRLPRRPSHLTARARWWPDSSTARFRRGARRGISSRPSLGEVMRRQLAALPPSSHRTPRPRSTTPKSWISCAAPRARHSIVHVQPYGALTRALREKSCRNRVSKAGGRSASRGSQASTNSASMLRSLTYARDFDCAHRGITTEDPTSSAKAL